MLFERPYFVCRFHIAHLVKGTSKPHETKRATRDTPEYIREGLDVQDHDTVSGLIKLLTDNPHCILIVPQLRDDTSMLFVNESAIRDQTDYPGDGYLIEVYHY